MTIEFDVVVLGAGVAGTSAALAAAAAGARVCIISGPPGASGLFSGAWRGPCPAALKDALEKSGYKLERADHPLPHPNGALAECDFATPSHGAARLHKPAVVVGVSGLPGFDASVLATLWAARSGAELRAVTITLPGTPPGGWAHASLAAFIEREPAVFLSALRERVKDERRIILPAVLGTAFTDELHANLQGESGCSIGEALGAPPSLPGWRLHNALQSVLTAHGIQITPGRAAAAPRVGERVADVSVGETTIRAPSFVLATGKFAAGGIEADGAFRETALDCPVWVQHLGDAFDTPDPLLLTDPVRTEDQPLLRAGVHADDEQRPVNRMHDVVYSNVFVAGSIRADWTAESHGAGHSAEDGWNAGLRAVRA